MGFEVFCSPNDMEFMQPTISSSQDFQAQLDDIENELTWFDNLGEGREGESAVQQGGMGSRVVG